MRIFIITIIVEDGIFKIFLVSIKITVHRDGEIMIMENNL